MNHNTNNTVKTALNAARKISSVKKPVKETFARN
jgi:hypothetical protein